jgi:mono/diheme cytochrome c family protein
MSQLTPHHRAVPASVALVLILTRVCLAPPAIAAQGSAPATADAAYFQAYHSVPRDTVTPVVYQGWKQYALNCARCHGDFGVGTSFAPALVESVKPTGTIPTPEVFLTTVCAGRPEKGMPAWCALGLDMDAMQVIYAYLLERSDGRVGLGRPAVRTE